MQKSVMTVKSMLETYVNYGLDTKTWEMFYDMTCHNLISRDNWTKFWETCKGWQYDPEEGRTIIDTDNGDKVVYEMDEDGYYVKVK